MEIDWNAIDKKWQKKWLENNDHETDSNNKEKKIHNRSISLPKLTTAHRSWQNIHHCRRSFEVFEDERI